MASSRDDHEKSSGSTYFSDIANPQKRTVIRDRRAEVAGDKFGTDVDRFMRRVLDRVKQAIQDNISEGKLGDIGKGAIKVPIPKELTREPYLHHVGMGKGFKRIFPGNKGMIPVYSAFSALPTVYQGNIGFDVGDKIPIPKGGGGGGKGKPGQGEPSDDGDDGEDDFIWVNEADYLDILFDGRKLPDMTKLKSKDTQIVQLKEAGQVKQGPFNRLNMPITDRKRREEELVLSKGSERRIFQTLASQFNILAPADKSLPEVDFVGVAAEERNEEIRTISKKVLGAEKAAFIDSLDFENSGQVVELFQETIAHLHAQNHDLLTPDQKEDLETLEMRLEEQLKQKAKIGGFRDEHLTYNFDKPKPKPNAKAVMFCLMDVSGSMGQEEKNTAKVFFWLLKKFLDANYKQVEMVYIAHTTQAKEVDEKTFFYGTETGGTIVSTCLQKTMDILKERYPLDEWNIYSAQASDGDNSYSDNEMIVKKMGELLPMLQAHYYLEVASSWRGQRPSSMYEVYDKLSRETNGKIQAAWGIRGAPGALDAFKKFFPAGGAKPSAQAELGL